MQKGEKSIFKGVRKVREKGLSTVLAVGVIAVILGIGFIGSVAYYRTEVQDLRLDKQAVIENLREAESELEFLRTGDRYNLYDPTYKQVKQFVEMDTTSENEYDEETYNCYHFTADFMTNALSEGMAVGFGYLIIEVYEPLVFRFDNIVGHAVAVFNTIDKGIVYVEVQEDVIMRDLKPGDDYLKKMGEALGVRYSGKWIITSISIIGWW